jgi:hypothetical protein
MITGSHLDDVHVPPWQECPQRPQFAGSAEVSAHAPSSEPAPSTAPSLPRASDGAAASMPGMAPSAGAEKLNSAGTHEGATTAAQASAATATTSAKRAPFMSKGYRTV